MTTPPTAGSDTSFFPLICEEMMDEWSWARPDFEAVWPHRVAPGQDPDACRVRIGSGTLEGRLQSIDLVTRELLLNTNGALLRMPLDRIVRVTMNAPLVAVPGRPALLPLASHERTLVLTLRGANERRSVRTVGYRETQDGLFVFMPVAANAASRQPDALVRGFLPREAYVALEIGPSAQEKAAQRMISTPAQLLAHWRAQARPEPLKLGDALHQLGWATVEQIESALALVTPDRPVGLVLVEAGVLRPADLHTALAYKMGTPMVDLARFPLDATLSAAMPMSALAAARAVPLMREGDTWFVAIDRLARLEKLRTISAFAQARIYPVVARLDQIVLALTRLSADDAWGAHTPATLRFEDSVF